jgi:hypothetical protein
MMTMVMMMMMMTTTMTTTTTMTMTRTGLVLPPKMDVSLLMMGIIFIDAYGLLV